MALNETNPGLGGVELKPDDRKYFDWLLQQRVVIIEDDGERGKCVSWNHLTGTVDGKPRQFYTPIDLDSGSFSDEANGTMAEVTAEFLYGPEKKLDGNQLKNNFMLQG